MIRKGYVEIQIEALGRMLAVALGLKKRGEVAPARQELREIGKRLCSLDPERMISMTDDSVASYLKPNRGIEIGKCLQLATILREQAELFDMEGRAQEALASRRKSLLLLAESIIHERLLHTPEFIDQADDLLARLAGEPFSNYLQARILEMHEALGRYDRAEDHLFRWREADPDGATAAGIEFYERLLDLTDDTLESGGLSRSEVVQAYRELQGK